MLEASGERSEKLKIDQAGKNLVGRLVEPWLMNAVVEAIESETAENKKLGAGKERLKEQLAQQAETKIRQASQEYRQARTGLKVLTHLSFDKMAPQQKQVLAQEQVVLPLAEIARTTPGYQDSYGLGKLILAQAQNPEACPKADRLLKEYRLNPGQLVTTVQEAIKSFQNSF